MEYTAGFKTIQANFINQYTYASIIHVTKVDWTGSGVFHGHFSHRCQMEKVLYINVVIFIVQHTSF